MPTMAIIPAEAPFLAFLNPAIRSASPGWAEDVLLTAPDWTTMEIEGDEALHSYERLGSPCLLVFPAFLCAALACSSPSELVKTIAIRYASVATGLLFSIMRAFNRPRDYNSCISTLLQSFHNDSLPTLATKA
ncbi:hypothetical protein Hypma_012703 [Hypsizygus marmoreus]|uniref:Uncharacterized protein n=1 Tax=Hypsizygus marmoreus TaxID=39966 RepID=A0A369JDY9_HYPMA|nr:hypothetical protein Hypma_012703 [Hypsizygus marmoreus]